MYLTEALDSNTTARICADGCLVADVRAARTGIQLYTGREVDPNNEHGLRDKATVKVYRPEEEVFATDSMASYAGAAITIDHPSVMVDSSNWRTYGRGEVNGDIARDGQAIRVPIIIRDASAVKAATTTHKQLSAGYTCKLDFTPGDFNGDTYDAIQREIRINHIAAVPSARGGSSLKIIDERTTPEAGKMPHTLIIDGLPVTDVSDGAKAAIEKLQGQIQNLTDAATTGKTEFDKQLGLKDGEIEKLKGQVVDAAQLDALADAKADVVGKAKAVLGDKLPDTKGKTVADVRRMAVAAKFGDAAVNDKSDDYVEARFDAMTADAKVEDNKVHSIGMVLNTDSDTVRTTAFDELKKRETEAWRTKAA
jgi:hypothetical protein